MPPQVRPSSQNRHGTLFPTSHLELHVKTVKYFKSIEYVQEQVEKAKRELENKGEEVAQVTSVGN